MLVRNQVRGHNFAVLEQSGEQARAIELGATVISVRHLHDGVINKIDAANSSFWAAQHGAEVDGMALGLMDRQRVRMWLRDVYREIDTIGV